MDKELSQADTDSIETLLALISAISFIIYGLLCIFTQHMVLEFKRYQLERFRILTGYLELLGGLGTLIGFQYKPLFLFSTTGLATLMLMGMIVRIRLKDPIIAMIPAFVLMSINAYLVIASLI